MSERVENMGKQVELRQKRQLAAAKCCSLRDTLRQCLPLEVDAGKLDQEKILGLALALKQELQELAGIDYMLGVINEQLGE